MCDIIVTLIKITIEQVNRLNKMTLAHFLESTAKGSIEEYTTEVSKLVFLCM